MDEIDLKVLSNAREITLNLKSIGLTLEDEVDITPMIPLLLNVTDLWLDCVKHQYDEIVYSLNNEKRTRLDVLEIYMRAENVGKKQSMPPVSRETYQNWDFMRPLNVDTHLTLHRSIRPMEFLHIVTASECLTKLNISHSSGIAGNLSILDLLYQSLWWLETLILSDCGLHSEDLRIIAKASTLGSLPKVKHLDVSYNVFESSVDLSCLFTDGCKWESLLHLNVRASSNHWFPFLNEKVTEGCLSSLQELRFSVVGSFSAGCSAQWSFLKNIYISYVQISKGSMVKAVRASVERGMFPSLELVTLSGSTSDSYSTSDTDDSSQPHSETTTDMDDEYDYADHYDLLKRGILVRFLQLTTDEAEILNRLGVRSEQGRTKSLSSLEGTGSNKILTNERL